jgi:hypothetical protein
VGTRKQVAPKAPVPSPSVDPFEIPVQWWEIAELVLNECPEDALKLYRKSVIGRGKPLTAAQADSAIRGARGVMRTGPKEVFDKKTQRFKILKTRAQEPESIDIKLARMEWYRREKMPVIVARGARYEYTNEEVELICEAEMDGEQLLFLVFDNDGVDRVEGLPA